MPELWAWKVLERTYELVARASPAHQSQGAIARGVAILQEFRIKFVKGGHVRTEDEPVRPLSRQTWWWADATK